MPVGDPTLRIAALEDAGLCVPATSLSSQLSATSEESLDFIFGACVPTSALHSAGFRASLASLVSV